MMRFVWGFVFASVVLTAVLVRAGDLVNDVVFEDGETHIVDAENSYPTVRVVLRNSEGGDDTRLSLVAGGVIGFGIRAEEDSNVNIVGGSYGGSLVTADVSTAAIRGGALEGSIYAEDLGEIHIRGYRFSLPLGEIEAQGTSITGILEDDTAFDITATRDLDARVVLESGTAVIANGVANVINAENDYYDASVVVRDGAGDAQTQVTVVEGGSVGSQLRAEGHSNVVVEGGTVHSLLADDDTTVAIHGGAIPSGTVAIGASLLVIDGGTISNIVAASGTATLRLVGSGFNHPDGPIAGESGTITGTLADATPISVSFVRATTATIELPEPGAASLACVAAMALAALRKRERLAR